MRKYSGESEFKPDFVYVVVTQKVTVKKQQELVLFRVCGEPAGGLQRVHEIPEPESPLRTQKRNRNALSPRMRPSPKAGKCGKASLLASAKARAKKTEDGEVAVVKAKALAKKTQGAVASESSNGKAKAKGKAKTKAPSKATPKKA